MSRAEGGGQAATGMAVSGRRWRAWLPTIIFTALILASSCRPVPVVLQGRQADKVLHAAVYGLLAVLAMRSGIRDGRRRSAFPAIVLAMFVGMTDEAIQAAGTQRTADRYDLLADVAGALAGAVMMTIAKRRSRDRIDNSAAH
jgi:VanZ family protein